MNTPFGGKQLTLLHIDHCFCSLLRTLLILSCVVGNRMQNHSCFFQTLLGCELRTPLKCGIAENSDANDVN